MTETRNDELPFRSDFAMRVMDEVDAITSRRRKARSVIAAMSVTIVAGIVAFGVWNVWPSSAPDTQRIPREIASSDDVEVADFQNAQPTLLDFVFPDAAALSQFSQQYDDSEDGDVMENDAVFFPDEGDDAIIDNS